MEESPLEMYPTTLSWPVIVSTTTRLLIRKSLLWGQLEPSKSPWLKLTRRGMPTRLSSSELITLTSLWHLSLWKSHLLAQNMTATYSRALVVVLPWRNLGKWGKRMMLSSRWKSVVRLWLKEAKYVTYQFGELQRTVSFLMLQHHERSHWWTSDEGVPHTD